MKRYFLVLVCASITSTATAQIHWWGLSDFEIRKGGEDSGLEKNNVPNDHVQLSLQELDLFFDADISSNITFTAKLATNPSKGLDFKAFELQLAYVTFSNLLGDALSFSAGKIVTPFGTFSKRQLSSENPFIGQPLFFSYRQNISPLTGYLGPQTTYLAYAQYGTDAQYGNRLTTLYPCGYFSGIEASGLIFGMIDYDVACMNAPLSGTNGDYNIDEGLAFHGRVAVHPGIWGTIGFSYAVGSYMQSSFVSQYFEQQYTSLNSFDQSTYGADLLLSYLYFEINAEYIKNQFQAPYIVYNSIYMDGSGSSVYNSGFSNGYSCSLESQEYYIDVKMDVPFYPGLYLAVRYNALTFNNIPGLLISSISGSSIAWDRNVVRSAIGLGYKPDHKVLIKLGYERTAVNLQPVPDLDVWGCAIVVTLQ
ncbi:MAG: hypothetical protein NTX44_00145 [Ignavibacteriales bacterium]|nr:hypothetical protein [Ignavibacteriales bacterium]